VNQQAVIQGPLQGIRKLTVGPAATYPSTQYRSPQGPGGDPFPTTRPGQVRCLTSHGREGHAESGSRPARRLVCRRGGKPGPGAHFTLPYTRGPTDRVGYEQLPVERQQRRITRSLTRSRSPSDRIARGQLRVAAHLLRLDMVQLGGGWTFVPDYSPPAIRCPERLRGELLRLHQRAQRLVHQLKTLTSTSDAVAVARGRLPGGQLR